jgi:ATP-dependent Clp protease ATP-binding subunit ClpA
MFERFTDRARRVVVLAQEESRMLNHNYIGTEHILLGLISEGDGVAARVIKTMGISLEAVRSQVEDVIGQGSAAPTGHIPFTPRAKKVLELSLREALQLGHNYIGTEHLLLGLVREGEGVAAQVLQNLGAELDRLRRQVIETLGGMGIDVPAEHEALDPPRVGPEGFRSTSSRGKTPEVSAAERRARFARIEELAKEEADRMGSSEVQEGHRWLGYVRLEIAGAKEDLEHLEAALEDGRRRLQEQLESGEPEGREESGGPAT